MCSGSDGRVTAMEEDYKDIEEMLQSVDYTKGSDHKERLKDRLFGEGHITQFSEELDLAEMKNVRAAVKTPDGFPGKNR